MFASQELLDLVKMSGYSLIVWLKDKVMIIQLSSYCFILASYISRYVFMQHNSLNFNFYYKFSVCRHVSPLPVVLI